MATPRPKQWSIHYTADDHWLIEKIAERQDQKNLTWNSTVRDILVRELEKDGYWPPEEGFYD